MSAKTEKKIRQAAREAGTDKKMLAAEAAAKARKQSKLRWTLALCGIAVFVVLTLLLNSNLIYKTTAFTVDGEKYSAADMSYRYASQYNYMLNQYGEYVSLFGLDTSGGIAGLKSQDCYMMEDGGTWRDYFLQNAKSEVIQTKTLCDYATANGITLDEDDFAEIESNFDGVADFAKAQGYANANKFFSASFGPGVDIKVVREAYKASALANKAYIALNDSFQYTDEQLKEKYESYNGDQDEYEFVYYFVQAESVENVNENGETVTSITEETLQAAIDTANAIVEQYNSLSGEVFERMDSAVASVVDGAGAYHQTNVKGGSLGDYKEWLIDSARKEGDICAIPNSSDSGCYVVAFCEHSDNDYELAQVRHILIKAEANADGVYTDEAKAKAEARAEEILAEFRNGERTEERFAELAELYSEDTGSNTNGGLYDSVYKGQMVDQFDAFCFGAHSIGETAIVYGESDSYAGYHVMYYVGRGQNYRDYIAENDLRATDVNMWLDARIGEASTADGMGMKFVG